MSTFDPDALECLAAIIEEGGFERAAQRLSITQSAVSQRLRALEAQVGTVLIVRSRPLKPTPAGQLMLKHAKMMRLRRADLEKDLKERAPSSTGGGREDQDHACDGGSLHRPAVSHAQDPQFAQNAPIRAGREHLESKRPRTYPGP